MNDFIYVAVIGLPIWWSAQTLLCLRDYLVRRSEVRRMPPPSEEEKIALARIRAELPVKEKKSIRWYQRQTAREIFVEGRLKKQRLLA